MDNYDWDSASDEYYHLANEETFEWIFSLLKEHQKNIQDYDLVHLESERKVMLSIIQLITEEKAKLEKEYDPLNFRKFNIELLGYRLEILNIMYTALDERISRLKQEIKKEKKLLHDAGFWD